MQNLFEFLKNHLDSKKANLLLRALRDSTDERARQFILQNITDIITWLNCDEFKKYEDNPYPPLLNPEYIDIEESDYCAMLAWNLNIPLKTAKFICISPHGVGAAAFLTLLNQSCNVYCPVSWVLPPRSDYRYSLNFKSLIAYCQSAINISEINVVQIDKYLSLIDQNTPILIQTRDPISLLKHNYGRDWSKVQRNYPQDFDLNCDYNCYIKFLTPQKTFIRNDFETLLENTFIMHFLLDKINHNNITYLDMSELSSDNIFSTFTYLAQKFDFTPPHNDDKDFFQRKEFRGYMRYLLPLNFHVDENIKLNITRFGMGGDDINIFDKISQNDLKNDIGIYIEQEKLDLFLKHKNYDKIKNYLSCFLDDVKYIVDYTEDTMMKESEVLAYLKDNLAARIKLKSILDKELIHIKQYRPDIVASWRHYQEFEKICKENT
ncbi:DUF2972 domain-containing protein [Campylobacter insulaenigrae]|uniref:DUF2972 domain-containing protein n=1 Tax=Campylobacter insulaenigrae TaxID=260714 RepID=UPI0024330C77|nr:DUF2972 domain-containing protein [Campylobacter insulaenigrae]